MRRPLALAFAFLSTAGCAASSPEPSAPPSSAGAGMTVAVAGEGTQITTTVKALELRVDGKRTASAETWAIGDSTAPVTAGTHTIEILAYIQASADAGGRASVWSTTERVRLGPGPSRVEVHLVLANDARPLAQRLEARFKSDKAEFVGGTVPTVVPLETTDDGLEVRPLAPGDVTDDPNETIARLTNARAEVARGVDQAKQARDVVRLTCQSGKLEELDAAMATAQAHLGAYAAAKASGNANGVQREAAVFATLSRHADQLVAESRACVGSTPEPTVNQVELD